MAERQLQHGQQDGRDRTRRRRRRDVPLPRASNPSSSDAENDLPRQDRATASRDVPYFYDTRSTSSRHSRTTDAVDGSIASLPHNDTTGYARYGERFASPSRPIYADGDNYPPRRNEDEMFGIGAWMNNPPNRGQPQPTYGHNGLYYQTTHPYAADIYSPPIAPHREDHQSDRYIHRASNDGGRSRSDELTMRRRSPERYTGYSDTPRQGYDYPRRPQYHETHEYDEHRDRHRRRDREGYVHRDEQRHRDRPRDSH